VLDRRQHGRGHVHARALDDRSLLQRPVFRRAHPLVQLIPDPAVRPMLGILAGADLQVVARNGGAARHVAREPTIVDGVDHGCHALRRLREHSQPRDPVIALVAAHAGRRHRSARDSVLAVATGDIPAAPPVQLAASVAADDGRAVTGHLLDGEYLRLNTKVTTAVDVLIDQVADEVLLGIDGVDLAASQLVVAQLEPHAVAAELARTVRPAIPVQASSEPVLVKHADTVSREKASAGARDAVVAAAPLHHHRSDPGCLQQAPEHQTSRASAEHQHGHAALRLRRCRRGRHEPTVPGEVITSQRVLTDMACVIARAAARETDPQAAPTRCARRHGQCGGPAAIARAGAALLGAHAGRSHSRPLRGTSGRLTRRQADARLGRGSRALPSPGSAPALLRKPAVR
jgi:hypothetical protein